MATYRQLLLSTGGGVVSDSQQDEQNNGATIAIGLGGTGVACLRNLKKRIYSRLQPDDPASPIPEYSHIRFLAVDADKSQLEADGSFNSLDETTEYLPISSGDISGLLRKTKELAANPQCKWLKTENTAAGQEGLSILSDVAGAGGVRQIGRLLLIQKSAEFVEKIQRTIADATRGIQGGADVTIHIFTGIGGGTGSGTFLDACYLIQEALERMGLGGKALTCGYVFLPDVNLSNSGIKEGSAVSKYIRANGFAAMKELDYCMNFQNNHGCWDQEYKGFHIGPVQDPPVKICHLISAHDIRNTNLPDGFSYAMNVVSDFVMQFLVKPEPASSGNTMTMQSHISNYLKSMSAVEKTAGACYQYCLLGASNATVPMKEIATYLSSRLFEEMSKGSSRRPTDGEAARFVEESGLTYDQLEQAILAGTSYRMPPIDLDYKQFKTMNESDMGSDEPFILPEVIVKPYRDRLKSNMLNKVTTNRHALTNDWSLDIIQKDQESVSRVCAVYFKLREYVINPEYGPFYAAELLNGAQTTNLINHLRGIQTQISNNLSSAMGDLSLRNHAVKQKRHEFLHSGALGKKKRFEELIAAVASYYTLSSKIEMLEQMKLMLPKMIKQFTELYDSHFMIYQSVNRNLIDTFHENYQTLSAVSLTEAVADPFILPLMKIEDMRDSLDAAVSSMKMDIQAQNFHAFLFDKPSVWNSGDENKISKEVSGYLVKVFQEYTNKSLMDYLQIRFHTTDPVKLTNLVHDKILQPLKDKAEALFWRSSGFDISVAQPLGYISIPDSASAILLAANKLVQNEKSLSECPSKMKDRIFFLKCLCGVPMYAYNGVSDYSREYENDRTVGKHIYEGSGLDPRDWRSLYNLQPYSVDRTPKPEIEEAARLYDQAEKLGIIRPNPEAPTEYKIAVRPSIDSLVRQAETAISTKNVQAIKQAAEAISRYQSEKQPESLTSVKNDGAPGHEPKVRKDHVLSSWEMIGSIRREIEKSERLETLLTQLAASKADISQSVMQKENFLNALYSGVIAVKPPKISYIEEIFGITKEVTLSDPRMDPYGKLVPLYQAYQSYRALPEDGRAKLDHLTEDRMSDTDTWQETMRQSCDRLLQIFSNQYMGLMQSQAQKVPDDTEDIIALLLEFRQGIDNFKLQNGLI